MIPKNLGKIFFGLMNRKLNFLEGLSCVTAVRKLTQHFIKKTSYQQSYTVVSYELL